MSWDKYVKDLKETGRSQFRPRGSSMMPRINSGDLVTVEAVSKYDVGDIVFCKVGSYHYVHLIKAIAGKGENTRYQIGNNRGGINGWVYFDRIFGKVTNIED